MSICDYCSFYFSQLNGDLHTELCGVGNSCGVDHCKDFEEGSPNIQDSYLNKEILKVHEDLHTQWLTYLYQEVGYPYKVNRYTNGDCYLYSKFRLYMTIKNNAYYITLISGRYTEGFQSTCVNYLQLKDRVRCFLAYAPSKAMADFQAQIEAVFDPQLFQFKYNNGMGFLCATHSNVTIHLHNDGSFWGYLREGYPIDSNYRSKKINGTLQNIMEEYKRFRM